MLKPVVGSAELSSPWYEAERGKSPQWRVSEERRVGGRPTQEAVRQLPEEGSTPGHQQYVCWGWDLLLNFQFP